MKDKGQLSAVETAINGEETQIMHRKKGKGCLPLYRKKKKGKDLKYMET